MTAIHVPPALRNARELVATKHDAFNSLQRAIERVFDDINGDIGRLAAAAHSRLDVSETGSQIKVTAEHPGPEEQDNGVSGTDKVPPVPGEQRPRPDAKNKKPARVATPGLDVRTVG